MIVRDLGSHRLFLLGPPISFVPVVSLADPGAAAGRFSNCFVCMAVAAR